MGVIALCVALVGGGYLLGKRRWACRSPPAHLKEGEGQDDGAEGAFLPQQTEHGRALPQPVSDLGGGEVKHEVDGVARSELDGGWNGHEMALAGKAD